MQNEAVMPHNLIRDNGDFMLIARFVAGDEAAFETLVRAYQHRFLMLSRRFLNDDTEAEDVVQEAFVDIYHGLKRFRHNASFQTWAYRILVRKCSERRKRASQRNMASISFDTLYALSAPDTMPVIDDMLVQQALLQLPDDARLLLILKYYEEFSSEDRPDPRLQSWSGQNAGTSRQEFSKGYSQTYFRFEM